MSKAKRKHIRRNRRRRAENRETVSFGLWASATLNATIGASFMDELGRMTGKERGA